MNLRGNIWLTKSRLNCNPADSNLLYLFKENELSLSCPYVKLDLTKSFWLTRWSWDHETWKGFYFIFYFLSRLNCFPQRNEGKLEDEGADWTGNLFYSSDWCMGRFGGRRYQFLFCRKIIASKVGCCFNEKKNRCSRLLMVFQGPAVRERYLYCLTVFFCEAWATKISRRLFPIQVSYFDGYTTKPTLIFCAWQVISESVSMMILTHLYAQVHASTASCLYCNGAILWNRYKRQSPSLKLFRTL